MSSNDKNQVQKNNFSSSLSDSESDNPSDSEDNSNQKNPKVESRILEQDSNTNFLNLNNVSTTITLNSISKEDIAKNYEKFKCENKMSDIPFASPIPDEKEDESLEDESIQDLVGNIQENEIDLNFEDQEEESLKMLGKKRNKSHNSEIDSDSYTL